MSGGLIRFITPGDVRDLKVRIDPSVRALDATVSTCTGLADGQRTAWREFSKAWRTYFEEDDSWLHAAAQHDTGEAYERQIADWQRLVGASCNVPGPRLQPAPSPAMASTELQDTIKTVAIAGAVIAVVVGVRSVMR